MHQVATHSLTERQASLSLKVHNMWEVQGDAAYASQRHPGTVPDHWIVIRTTAGEGQLITWDNDLHLMAANSCLLIPYLAISCYGTAKKQTQWTFTWVEFEGPKHLGDILRLPVGAVATTGAAAHEAQFITQLRHAIPDPFANAMAGSILGTWLWELAQRTHTQAVHDSATVLVREACQWLEQQGDPFVITLTVEAWADACGVSSRYLRQSFAKALNQSPKQFLEARALTRAMDRLRFTTDSIAEIANTLGFSSPFHFSNRFKRYFGTPPSHVRKTPTTK